MAAVVMYTVLDALVLCGIPDAEPHNGVTKAARVANDMFNDDFRSCMDKTFEEVGYDFKGWSDLTVAQGQMRFQPGVKNKVKAFIQWCRDEYRLGRDPATAIFPVADTATLIRRYKTHTKYVTDSKTMAEAAKPEKFTSETKWEDWAPTFLNYLKAIPGRDGVPLKYVIREQEAPDPTPNIHFLDDYIAMAPLHGESFAIDSAQVHTFIVNFIAGNEVAESKIRPNLEDHDGRTQFRT